VREKKKKPDMLGFSAREISVFAISMIIFIRSWQTHYIGEMILGIGLLLALSGLNYAWTQYQSTV
jgi:uncharacterized membrane protein YqjE